MVDAKVLPFKKPLTAVTTGVEAALPRDQWDRPKIIQPDGSLVAYRRASTVAEVLEDHYGLEKWHARLEAEGLAQRPDLLQAIHTANPKEIGLIVEQAIEQAGGSVASRNGSTMHTLTEQLDNTGDVPLGLPSNIVAMLEVYEKTVARFQTLETERFTVCDKIKCGGTYDKLVLDSTTGTKHIADLKTGQNLKYLGVKTPAQVAVYAAGMHYDLDGEREPHGADRDRGLLVWLPWTLNPAEAICELRWLDLRIGRAAIMEAMRVEKFRKLSHNQTMPHVK